MANPRAALHGEHGNQNSQHAESAVNRLELHHQKRFPVYLRCHHPAAQAEVSQGEQRRSQQTRD